VPQDEIVVGVIVAPRVERDVDERLRGALVEGLSARYPSQRWRADLQIDRLVAPPASESRLFEAARSALLAGRWDMGVVVTDLPLRHGRRLVWQRTSRTHRVALVSLPALGPLHVRERLNRALLDLVGLLIGGDVADLPGRRGDRAGPLPLLFVPAVLIGNLRLLAGMVRANRPWRLAARLYGALVAAVAAAAYGIVTSDIWRLAAAMGWVRLTLMCVVSIAATALAVVVVHELWERAPEPAVRSQVVLFNLATTATVVLGILTLYATLFVLILVGAELVITPRLLTRELGRHAGLPDYGTLAWFVASLATVGGALGAGLESDEAVREAAYAGSHRAGDEAHAGTPDGASTAP
jgi:hypothetical protein